ncbi:reverse transcriptase domain-containing protein [Tanacetum coccineum]
MARRLRWYFKAHPVKVITDQPIKQILSKTEASGKLAKYVVELGAYNITLEPRNAVKGQVLADFITEMPDGESPEKYFRTPKITPERDETEEWTLFTDGASSSKGSRAGLVMIGPSGVEHTYALRLTFDSTNNEAEYEALLAGLRIAKRMNIQRLEAKEYIACFKSLSIKNIPRNQNQKVDVLSKLASVAFNYLTKEVLVEVLNERSTEVKEGLESVSIRCIQCIGYDVLGFLGVGTTFDIFQNIHILYLQYGVLVFTGYGVLVLCPSWSLVSAGTDTPYLP